MTASFRYKCNTKVLGRLPLFLDVISGQRGAAAGTFAHCSAGLCIMTFTGNNAQMVIFIS
jgi:hypothetical protein